MRSKKNGIFPDIRYFSSCFSRKYLLQFNPDVPNMKREDQQNATIRCLLLTSVSTCFGHHYAHLQENKGPVTCYCIWCIFWFCWMWLVAVVRRCLAGCKHCSHPARQRLTTATNHIQQNQKIHQMQ